MTVTPEVQGGVNVLVMFVGLYREARDSHRHRVV